MRSKLEKTRKVGDLAVFDWKRAIVFLLLWIFVSGAIFSSLYFSGLMPGYVKEFTEDAFGALAHKSEAEIPPFSKNSALILIPKINLVSPIVFPTSTDLAILNKSLYSGVAHYPKSALPGEGGNVFIFGHSSNRPFVRNQSWTAFTKLHKLEKGDDIFISSAGVKYHYRATSIEIVDPKETRVYLNSDKPKLTLSTCWPVGDPKNRTVVEAEFVEKSMVN